MIRFIDLRDQIYDIEDVRIHFAFFDTIRSKFITVNGCQEWTGTDDFNKDLGECGDEDLRSQRNRFVALMPEWSKGRKDHPRMCPPEPREYVKYIKAGRY